MNRTYLVWCVVPALLLVVCAILLIAASVRLQTIQRNVVEKGHAFLERLKADEVRTEVLKGLAANSVAADEAQDRLNKATAKFLRGISFGIAFAAMLVLYGGYLHLNKPKSEVSQSGAGADPAKPGPAQP